jgi:hypothetical protein
MSEQTTTMTPDPIEAPEEKKNPASMVPVTSGGIAISNLNDLMRFAAVLVKDGAVPKGWNVGQAAVAIQSGLQVGLGLLGGLQQGAVINGIFSWRGQAAVALIQNSGKCKPGSLRFGCRGEGDQRVGFAVAHRVGYEQPEERTFSVKDARLAGLWTKSGAWHDYPERQLAWRAVGFLARDVFPDVLGGFPLAEEAVDFQENEKKPERSAGPRPELPPPASPDPLMDAIAGKIDPGLEISAEVVEAELVPEATEEEAAPEPEQQELIVEDRCSHGKVLSEECPDCDREYLEAEQ